MLTFNLATPDQGVSPTTKTRVLTSQFGDGYSQRTPDGINSVTDSWPLNFTLRTRALVKSIADFLKARAGSEAFYWMTPNGDTIKVICKEWTPTYNHDTDCSISCTFEQVFDL